MFIARVGLVGLLSILFVDLEVCLPHLPQAKRVKLFKIANYFGFSGTLSWCQNLSSSSNITVGPESPEDALVLNLSKYCCYFEDTGYWE